MKNLLALLFLLVAFSFSSRAVAACPSDAPVKPHDAIVRVDALEHLSLGVVVGAPDLVAVPYDVIEVDAIGGPDAYVLDAAGNRHRAHLVTSDREHDVALLRTDVAIATPIMLSASDEEPCAFDVDWKGWDDHVAAYTWVRAGAAPAARAVGTPVIDASGRLVGLSAVSLARSRIPASAIEALVASGGHEGRAGRRSLIGYGAIGAVHFEFAPHGGLWWGAQAGFAARYRDLLEARVDLSLTFLAAHETEEHPCGEPPCLEGMRFATTHSIGLHLRVASLSGALHLPIAITPSIGWALVAQYVNPGDRSPVFDVRAPPTWSTLAPGIAASVSVLELGFRVRMPRGEQRAPTYELTLSFVL